MKTFLVAILLTLGMAGLVEAQQCPDVVSGTTTYTCTTTVFNDSGSTLTSGTVVVWDSADTDFSTTGYPYVITSTTADDPYTAGVMQTGSCLDQSLCAIVTRGFTDVLIANSTDDTAEDTQIGTTTVAGQAGDYATGANTCTLGTLVSYHSADTAVNSLLGRVFVDIDCD